MKKKKLYKIIAVILILTVSCLLFEGCTSTEQFDKFYKKYPGAIYFVMAVFAAEIGRRDAINEGLKDLQDSKREMETAAPTPEEIAEMKANRTQRYNMKLLESLLDQFDFSSKKDIKVIGVNKDFKAVGPQPISSTVTFSVMQGVGTGSISISEEDMEKVVEGIEGENGSITLKGNIESPYSLSPLTLVVNLGTGEITGSFTGSYEYEGFDGMFYTDQPDTAKAKAEIKGKVNLVTGKIVGTGDLVYTWVNAGGEENWPFIVEGVLSSDYKSANGDFVFSEGAWPWNATIQ